MTYELFQQGPEVFLPVLLVSLVITIVAYGALPLIIASTRKKVISIKKYRWFCFGSNLIVVFLFSALNGGARAGGGYGLWTWVFSSLGLSILRSRYLLEDFKPIKRPASEATNKDCIPTGGWRCSCGRNNAAYVSTCYCGLTKRDIQHSLGKSTSTSDTSTNAVGDHDQICFCRKCGEKLIDNSIFCRKCGTRIVKE